MLINFVSVSFAFINNIKLEPEDHWSCIAHLSAEDMLN